MDDWQVECQLGQIKGEMVGVFRFLEKKEGFEQGFIHR
jgi:hypothetical protein